MAFYVNIVSESEALRKLNLPATATWRKWLRDKLPHHELGAGKVYNVHQVEELNNKDDSSMGSFGADLESIQIPSASELGKMLSKAEIK